MKEKFFEKAEELTIKAVKNFLVNEQSKKFLEAILLKIWQIREGKLEYAETDNKVKSIISMLQSLKTLIDKTHPEYEKGQELGWAMTVIKFAHPRLYLKLKEVSKEKNPAYFPLFAIKNSVGVEINPYRLSKQTVNELTFEAFREIAGVAFWGDKTDNPFVKEIAEKLNKEVKQMSQRETIKKLSEIK